MRYEEWRQQYREESWCYRKRKQTQSAIKIQRACLKTYSAIMRPSLGLQVAVTSDDLGDLNLVR